MKGKTGDTTDATVYNNWYSAVYLSGTIETANLASLSIGSLTLTPSFTAEKTAYTATTSNSTNVVSATAVAADAEVIILVNGSNHTSGQSATWDDGENTVIVVVTNGSATKTYRVTVHPRITEEQLTALTTGVVVDGRKSMPASIRVITAEKERTVLEIVLEEGRNRQIRKMCEAIGLEVARLKRIAIGPVKLGMLQPGKFRELSADEMRAIRAYHNKLSARSDSK